MQYRRLGKTGLQVSEIGFGGEWIERMTLEECQAIVRECENNGVNILDCWMSDPVVRQKIGESLKNTRKQWYIQGHIGSTWQNGQYVRTRDVERSKEAFEDLLRFLKTDHIDLGMIHYVDSEKDWDDIVNGPFIEYVRELKREGKILHIGMSSHNPKVAKKAILSGELENLMFSINPAFDLMPPSENVEDLFNAEKYAKELSNVDPERAELYALCEELDIGITVMKGFGGGRLFKPETSPLGIALTPLQCLHYALTRPAVAAVMCGFSETRHVCDAVRYETASDQEKDYTAAIAGAPKHAYKGKCMYCNHCKPCPMDIDVAMVNKYLDLATIQPEVPASVREHYHALEHNASECLGCGSCEIRCPFEVPIVDRMELARKVFG